MESENLSATKVDENGNFMYVELNNIDVTDDGEGTLTVNLDNLSEAMEAAKEEYPDEYFGTPYLQITCTDGSIIYVNL